MNNPKRKLRNRILNWIKSQGVVFCTDPTERERFTQYIAPVVSVFPECLDFVTAFYVYRQSEQTEPLSENDGICWKDVTLHDGDLYAIGISTEALDRGQEYTAFCFLHELCHIYEYDTGHGINFHNRLNAMITRYNECTGSTISNDFFALPVRFDCTPYTPLNNPIPKQETHSGKQFRAG